MVRKVEEKVFRVKEKRKEWKKKKSVARWRKRRRRQVDERMRKSDDDTFAPRVHSGGLSSIIYNDVSRDCSLSQTVVYGGIRPLRYAWDSEKRQAASFFRRLFSPMSTSYAYMCVCVCVYMCSAFPLPRIKEKRGGSASLRPLFDWIFTGKGKRRLVLEAQYSVRTCTIIPEYLPVATRNQQRHTQITISEEDVFPPEVLANDYSTIRYRQQRFM